MAIGSLLRQTMQLVLRFQPPLYAGDDPISFHPVDAETAIAAWNTTRAGEYAHCFMTTAPCVLEIVHSGLPLWQQWHVVPRSVVGTPAPKRTLAQSRVRNCRLGRARPVDIDLTDDQ